MYDPDRTYRRLQSSPKVTCRMIKSMIVGCVSFVACWFLHTASSYPVVAGEETANNETLKEVLENARIREKPDKNAPVVSLLPGGFVVAVQEVSPNSEWYMVDDLPDSGIAGYVHRGLLAHPSTSYQVESISSGQNRILNFLPRSDLSAIHPQGHARLYNSRGNLISHLPRMSDLERWDRAVRIYPDQLDSDFPFYRLTYFTGGAHGSFTYRFISKNPFGEIEFDVNTRIEDLQHNGAPQSIALRVWDKTYTYWAYSYAESPVPSVVLGLKAGELDVYEAEMRTSPPTEDELRRLLSEQPPLLSPNTSDISSHAVAILTGVMLELIYSGNAVAAYAYLKAAWPDELVFVNERFRDRESYKSELKQKIKSSRYYRDWMLSKH